MIVWKGVGTWGPPLRRGHRPEIPRFQLSFKEGRDYPEHLFEDPFSMAFVDFVIFVVTLPFATCAKLNRLFI